MSDRWEVPPLPISKVARIPTAAGGLAMTDEEYNRKWFARLMKRTIVNERGCFVWTGPVGHKGYIMMSHRMRSCAGHRMVYMLTHKVDLPREQQVCHSCDERRCWNPGHLFLGTDQDNAKDMAEKKRHQNNRKTECAHGHPFTPENTVTYIDVRGWKHRKCLTCERNRPIYRPLSQKAIERRRERQRLRRARLKAERSGLSVSSQTPTGASHE